MDEFLTVEQERELVKLAHAGDIEARNKVVMNVDRMVWWHAKKHARGRPGLAQTLHSEAIAKLCEKFHQFDPVAFDCRFTTWAHSWVRAAIGTYFRSHGHKGIRLLSHGANDFSLKDLFIDHRECSPDDSTIRHDRIELVRQVLARLHPRYREILLLRTELNLEGVGERLGVTRERIRQLEGKAQKKFLQEAERIGSPIIEELEHDIRDSNRHWSKRFFEKRGHVMSESNGVLETKESKKSRIERYLRENGDCKGKQIKEALLVEGFTVYDPDISNAKRAVFGGKPAESKPAKATGGLTLERMREVKQLATQIGGLDSLIEACQFLKELSAA